MIEAYHLTKYYGDKLGVEDVSFTVPKGEIAGLLGPNGAGKSTVMNMLTGYLFPSAGSIVIDGVDALQDPREARSRVGFLPETPPLYTEMPVEEYLRFVAEIKGISRQTLRVHVNEIMERTAIAHVKSRLIGNLSKGYRQRVGLAGALTGYPKALILDEPTVGLDPEQIIEVRELLRSLAQEHTILISSHILSEIQAVAKSVVILSQGRVAAAGRTEALLRGDSSFYLTILGDEFQVLELVKSVEGIASAHPALPYVRQPEGTCRLLIEEAETEVRAKLFYKLAEARMPILELSSAAATLEQFFLDTTSGAGEKKV